MVKKIELNVVGNRITVKPRILRANPSDTVKQKNKSRVYNLKVNFRGACPFRYNPRGVGKSAEITRQWKRTISSRKYTYWVEATSLIKDEIRPTSATIDVLMTVPKRRKKK